MAAAKILVVDDDPAIRNLVFRFLRQKTYEVEASEDGKSALEKFAQFKPDLVILDVNLPDYNGYTLCEQMHKESDVYILMLTSRSDPADKIKGFSLGADDYLTKPFDLQELEYRVQAILRRQRSTIISKVKKNITHDKLFIDPQSREVKISNQVIFLTSLEFDILYLLASNPNKAWRREELIEQIWNYEFLGDQRVVDVHIGQIRKKIEPYSEIIKTIRGVGYKFEEDKV
jgi:two-component system, OmpR family, response regulator